MTDRFEELLQAVGDRKLANDLLNDCTDAEMREKLINYIQQKDDFVCSILASTPTKIDVVDKVEISFEFNEKILEEEIRGIQSGLSN